MPFMFENLEVYQKAIDFAEQITSLTERFPRCYYFLTDGRFELDMLQDCRKLGRRFTPLERIPRPLGGVKKR